MSGAVTLCPSWSGSPFSIPPSEREFERVVAALGATRADFDATVACPVRHEPPATLTVTLRGRLVEVSCSGGCASEPIAAALGIGGEHTKTQGGHDD